MYAQVTNYTCGCSPLADSLNRYAFRPGPRAVVAYRLQARTSDVSSVAMTTQDTDLLLPLTRLFILARTTRALKHSSQNHDEFPSNYGTGHEDGLRRGGKLHALLNLE
jgi:hypothetical protein